MKLRYLFVLLTLGLLLVAPIALAETAAAAAPDASGGGSDVSSYFKVVAEEILPTIFMLALPILLLLLRRLISYLEKKWSFELGDQTEAALMEAVSRGVSYAEEKALQAVKTGDEIPDGAAKLKAALEYAVSEMQRLKLDELARDKLVALIEAKLHEKRAKGEVVAPPKE